ncbi:M55 family metallopeptidase [Serratia ureilytica]
MRRRAADGAGGQRGHRRRFRRGHPRATVADSHAKDAESARRRLDGRARLQANRVAVDGGRAATPTLRTAPDVHIGYHSAAGGMACWRSHQRPALLPRPGTRSGGRKRSVTAAAAELNVPLAVSGDDELQRWVAERYPHVGYACVKRAISQTRRIAQPAAGARRDPRAAMQQVRGAGAARSALHAALPAWLTRWRQAGGSVRPGACVERGRASPWPSARRQHGGANPPAQRLFVSATIIDAMCGLAARSARFLNEKSPYQD